MIRKGSFLDHAGRVVTALVLTFIVVSMGVGINTIIDNASVYWEPQAVVAAVPMATPAPPDPPGECFEWMVAGVQMIHKCIDEDEEIVCYAPVGGVLQCLARN